MCPRRCALRGTAPSKKEKSYAHTTTVSFRGDLRADAVGRGVDHEGPPSGGLWLCDIVDSRSLYLGAFRGPTGAADCILRRFRCKHGSVCARCEPSRW